ncbi:hypothetical protein P5673_021148 [Acropora cervicornis]|uniref:Uncharacterized protein n=1 Tax=Acropora cervicornis TaxID=6130 RepID=A0AAD9Q972_ACRCE|nr:hypothetical protein P5673_021148 [Acropora cervicornis]
MLSSGPLLGKESIWSDLTPICFEKLGRLDQEEVQVIISLWRKICSTAGRRLCPYARIIALWCDKDGVVRPGMLQPGIIRYFIVHSLEIDGSQKSHAFAVVSWLKSAEENFGFGNPLSVWCANDFEHAGLAVFLPVQRIHCKFLSADKVSSGQTYLRPYKGQVGNEEKGFQ